MTAATWKTKPYPNMCPIHEPCDPPCCAKTDIVEHRITRPMTLRSFMIPITAERGRFPSRDEFDGAGYAGCPRAETRRRSFRTIIPDELLRLPRGYRAPGHYPAARAQCPHRAEGFRPAGALYTASGGDDQPRASDR